MISTFRGIANATQLQMLTQILNDYCRSKGIVAASSARESAACHIMDLFRGGATTEKALASKLFARTWPM